ncbi:MAG: hypothetical protein V3W41_21130 [Planctomycetota bacterium]
MHLFSRVLLTVCLLAPCGWSQSGPKVFDFAPKHAPHSSKSAGTPTLIAFVLDVFVKSDSDRSASDYSIDLADSTRFPSSSGLEVYLQRIEVGVGDNIEFKRLDPQTRSGKVFRLSFKKNRRKNYRPWLNLSRNGANSPLTGGHRWSMENDTPILPGNRVRFNSPEWYSDRTLHHTYVLFRLRGSQDELEWGEAIEDFSPQAVLDHLLQSLDDNPNPALAMNILNLARFIPLQTHIEARLSALTAAANMPGLGLGRSRRQNFMNFQMAFTAHHVEQAAMAAGITDKLDKPLDILFDSRVHAGGEVQAIYRNFAKDRDRPEEVRVLSMARAINGDRRVTSIEDWIDYAETENLPGDNPYRNQLIAKLESQIAGRKFGELALIGLCAAAAVLTFLFFVRRFVRKAMFA